MLSLQVYLKADSCACLVCVLSHVCTVFCVRLCVYTGRFVCVSLSVSDWRWKELIPTTTVDVRYCSSHTHTHHAQHVTTDHSAGICCMYGCTVLNEPMGSPFPCSVSYFCMCVSVCLFVGCFINSLRGKITAEIPLWLNYLFLDVTWNIVWSPSLSLSLSHR